MLQDRMVSSSPQQTMQFGSDWAKKLQPGDVVIFSGHLGSGKTTCIRGVCTGLDVNDPVLSPTFTLINEYHGRMAVYHFDFFRIHEMRELRDVGVEEYFSGRGVCLVEWPEVIRPLLPSRHYRILMSHISEKVWPLGESKFNHLSIKGRRATALPGPKRQKLMPVRQNMRLIEVYSSDRPRH